MPVFNLVPAQGEPARLGFEVIGKVPIVIDTAVRSGSDYGVIASVTNATQTAGLLSSQLTLWGVPGDTRNNQSRGWECVAGGFYAAEVESTCPTSAHLPEHPFLTLPTSCPADPAIEPLVSSMEGDSWEAPNNKVTSEYTWMGAGGETLGFEGCQQLPFTPSIAVSTDTGAASTPTAVHVAVKVPQTTTLEASGLAEADVRSTTVALPAGMQLNPSAANGLQACSEAQVGYEGLNTATGMQDFTDAPAACPDAAKVATVHVKTPLLPHELEGGLYLASPAPNGETGKNPFNSLVALYLIAQDPVSGVLVKLAGEGVLNQTTGQLTTSFKGTPQVPFEELAVDVFGGQRASLSTPAHCGSYAASTSFDAWSGAVAAPSSEPAFNVVSGPSGEPCPAGALPFAPSFEAQSAVTQAGAFSPFDLELIASGWGSGVDGGGGAFGAGDGGFAVDGDAVCGTAGGGGMGVWAGKLDRSFAGEFGARGTNRSRCLAKRS